jgi:hypothetical protein
MHVQLARIADCPELAMSEGDARTLMASAQNVLRHYSIQATQRAVDWITFGSVAMFMYVPRAVALVQRRQRSNAPPPPQWQGSAQVFQFTPPPQQQPQQQPQPQQQDGLGGAAIEPDFGEQPEQLH